MLDNKFIVTILALVATAMAVCKYSNASKTKENFFPTRTWKVSREVAPCPAAVKKGDFYSIPGTYQAILNPRFSNVDYGANIRYNAPSYEHLGAPCNPLTFGAMAKEGYTPQKAAQAQTKENYGCGSCGGGCVTTCSKGGATPYQGGAPVTPANFSAGNFQEVTNAAYTGKDASALSTSMLPVQSMTTVNAAGETVQPIVYDRFMYANRNSRLRSQGDPIRGDLPIVPCGPQWFRPSVHPNIDLQQGAMNVLAGVNNEVTQAMNSLMVNTAGDYTVAGTDLKTVSGMSDASACGGVNMSTQYTASAAAGGRDVTVTAYP